jgi:adhesin transport system outer membrane protein
MVRVVEIRLPGRNECNQRADPGRALPALRRTLAALLLVLPGASFLAPAALAQTLEQTIRLAIERYPAAAAARANAASAAADVDRARAARWPVIGLGATGINQERTPRPWVTGPQASYTIYAGGGIEAGVDRAEALAGAADSRAATTFDDIALQAAEAYLAWARGSEQVSLAEDNLAAHERIVDDVRRIVAIDSGRRIDLMQAEVRLDAARLVLTQRTIDRDQAGQRLARFLDGATPARPEGIDVEPGTAPSDIALAQSAARDSHPQLAQLAAQWRAASAAVSVAEAQHQPRADVSVARALNPYTQLLDTVVQMNLTLAVFDGGAINAGVNAARAQARAARFALDEGRLLVRERIGTAWLDWQSAERRVALAEAQGRIGSTLVQGYREQFRLARRSLLDLLNIQNEAFGYEAAAAHARHDRRLARYRLSAAMGDLARRHRSADPS